MKVCATFHKKVPVQGMSYASQGFQLTVEAEVPHKVGQDASKLRAYVHRLFAECRARVEDELETVGRGPSLEDCTCDRRFHRPTEAEPDELRDEPRVSDRQMAYLRGLVPVGDGEPDPLEGLSRERFSCLPQDLSRSEASSLITELRQQRARTVGCSDAAD